MHASRAISPDNPAFGRNPNDRQRHLIHRKIAQLQRQLDAFAFRDVADHRHVNAPLLLVKLIAENFHRKHCAILAPVPPQRDLPAFVRDRVPGFLRFSGDFHGFQTDEFSARVAIHFLRRRIHLQDLIGLVVHQDHGVGGGGKKPLITFFRLLLGGLRALAFVRFPLPVRHQPQDDLMQQPARHEHEDQRDFESKPAGLKLHRVCFVLGDAQTLYQIYRRLGERAETHMHNIFCPALDVATRRARAD